MLAVQEKIVKKSPTPILVESTSFSPNIMGRTIVAIKSKPKLPAISESLSYWLVFMIQIIIHTLLYFNHLDTNSSYYR